MFTPLRSQLPDTPEGRGCFGQTLGKYNSMMIHDSKADILKIVESQLSSSDVSTYVIGDYGVADGAASMSLIHDVIALVRKQSGDQRPVQVIYEDQHCNDFNSLFRRLHGELPDPPTYLSRFPDVFTMATATNFFQQCVPDGTMDLIVTFSTVHWLSRPLKGFKDAIFAFLDASPAEQEEARRQAAEDWETFLLLRARELKAGGCLALLVLGRLPTEDSSGYTYCAHDFCLALEQVWRKFRDTGKITEEEFDNTVASEYFRNAEELRAPFDDPESPVRSAGLSLVAMQSEMVPCPFKAEWKDTLERSGVDARQEAVSKMVQRNRFWSGGILAKGLNPDRADKEEVLSSVYEAVTEHLQALPFKTLRNDYSVIRVLVRKDMPGGPRARGINAH